MTVDRCVSSTLDEFLAAGKNCNLKLYRYCLSWTQILAKMIDFVHLKVDQFHDTIKVKWSDKKEAPKESPACVFLPDLSFA